MAEVMRVPTPKEKLKPGQTENNATVALARYPILMAADIMIADSTHVPVGADQIPHIEITRKLARNFNRAYGKGEDVLVEPDLMVIEGIKIAALNGAPKMSKSKPNGAIFLKDSPDVVARKIRRAQTAEAGTMTDVLASHFLLGERLATTEAARAELSGIRDRHMDGQQVMGEFKDSLTEVTTNYLQGFQERFAGFSDADTKRVLRSGGEAATAKAEEVMERVNTSLGFVSAKFLYED
jgi:tryptophanyl-tRNA synthetase